MANVTASGVLLYYPNLIGYLRIACMLGAFYYHCYREDWVMFLVLYLAAFGGDVVDGYVARLFHQQSVFGGVLDMVTDRVSTCGLLTLLATIPAYENMRFAFVMLIALDIFSHWFHVSSVQGHHKSSEVLAHRNSLLRWYYSVYPLFGFCCVGTELFYVFLYFQSFKGKPAAFKMSSDAEDAAIYLGFTACMLKQAVNVVQLCSAAVAMAEQDAIAASAGPSRGAQNTNTLSSRSLRGRKIPRDL